MSSALQKARMSVRAQDEYAVQHFAHELNCHQQTDNSGRHFGGSRMSKLPALRYREVVERLRAHGFVFDRPAKGSHEIRYNPQSKRRTTVPHHPGSLPMGTCGQSFDRPA